MASSSRATSECGSRVFLLKCEAGWYLLQADARVGHSKVPRTLVSSFSCVFVRENTLLSSLLGYIALLRNSPVSYTFFEPHVQAMLLDTP